MKGSKLSKKETLNGSAEIPDAKKPRHAVQRQPVHLAYLGSGRGYHVKKWLPALVAQGLRVTLYSFHAPETTLQGVDVVVLRPPFSRSLARLSWVDFCGPTRRLCRLLLERDVDVLMPSYATSYGWLGARTGFRPMLLNTWTFDVSVYPFEGARRFVFKPVVQYAMRRADVVLTDGAGLADFVRTRYPIVPSVVKPVLWGIPLDDYDFSPEIGVMGRKVLGIPAGVPVVISARGIKKWYAPEVVLPVFERILAEHTDVHVIVLTLAHERSSRIQSLLALLASHPRAHVIDRFLSKREMCEAWAASDVLVSVPPYDGISVGVLEGMYAGVVPVLSDIPSNRSIIKAGAQGYLLQNVRVGVLVDKLGDVLTQLPTLKASMAPHNRRWITENANVEIAAKRLANIVRGCFGQYSKF